MKLSCVLVCCLLNITNALDNKQTLAVNFIQLTRSFYCKNFDNYMNLFTCEREDENKTIRFTEPIDEKKKVMKNVKTIYCSDCSYDECKEHKSCLKNNTDVKTSILKIEKIILKQYATPSKTNVSNNITLKNDTLQKTLATV